MNLFALLGAGIFMNASLGFVTLSIADSVFDWVVGMVYLISVGVLLYVLLDHLSKKYPQLKMEKED